MRDLPYDALRSVSFQALTVVLRARPLQQQRRDRERRKTVPLPVLPADSRVS